MRKTIAISPHFDDAVLSAGQFLAGRPDVDVITVFGGMPKNENVQTTYDAKCGFKNAKEALIGRIDENNQALALLRSNPINLDFKDSQYGEPFTVDEIAQELQSYIEQEDYEFILGPLGLGHPDHAAVTSAILKLNTKLPIYLWEDLPLRVLEPQLVGERLKEVKRKLELQSPGTGPIADKVRALWCYRSQIGTGILDPYIMYVPERFWK